MVNEPISAATAQARKAAAKKAPAAPPETTSEPASAAKATPAKAASGQLVPTGQARTQHAPGRAAALSVQRREHVTVSLPLLGRVQLPHPQDMAYYGGIGALVVLEMLEWPAAVALAVGHALTSQHHNRALDEFGQALEDA
jgi:hypothetical protein